MTGTSHTRFVSHRQNPRALQEAHSLAVPSAQNPGKEGGEGFSKGRSHGGHGPIFCRVRSEHDELIVVGQHIFSCVINSLPSDPNPCPLHGTCGGGCGTHTGRERGSAEWASGTVLAINDKTGDGRVVRPCRRVHGHEELDIRQRPPCVASTAKRIRKGHSVQGLRFDQPCTPPRRPRAGFVVSGQDQGPKYRSGGLPPANRRERP